jgi:hypothetical protein
MLNFVLNENPKLFLQCAGAMILLYVLMALRMSLFRLSQMGSKRPLSKEKEAAIETFYEHQMLCSEWAPAICAGALACFLKFTTYPESATKALIPGSTLSTQVVAQIAVVTWVASRFLFHGKLIINTPVIGIIGMSTGYFCGIIVATIIIIA